MPPFQIAMSLIGLSIVIIQGGSFRAGDGTLLLLEGLQQQLQPPTQESHLGVAVDLCLLRKGEPSRPSRIDRATHATGGSHQCGLRFQAAVRGLGARHISRGVVLLEDGGIVMLQDDVPLCVRNRTCTPMSMKSTRGPRLLTAVVESLPITPSEGVWTRGKFHAGDASEVGHLWAESGVSQSCLLRHLDAFRSMLAPPEQRSFCHLLLQRQA